MEAPSVKKILLKAAAICESRGMCSGALEDKSGKVCVLGALIIAQTGDVNGTWWPILYGSKELGAHIGKSFLSDWSNNLVEAGKAHVVIQALKDAAKSIVLPKRNTVTQ